MGQESEAAVTAGVRVRLCAARSLSLAVADLGGTCLDRKSNLTFRRGYQIVQEHAGGFAQRVPITVADVETTLTLCKAETTAMDGPLGAVQLD